MFGLANWINKGKTNVVKKEIETQKEEEFENENKIQKQLDKELRKMMESATKKNIALLKGNKDNK